MDGYGSCIAPGESSGTDGSTLEPVGADRGLMSALLLRPKSGKDVVAARGPMGKPIEAVFGKAC